MNVSNSDILASKILIVDDQAANVSLLERVLEEAGYSNVNSTLNPRETVPLHRKNDYDLILLDLQMPGVDGFEVMDRLKADQPSGYVPVLVITAQPGHKQRALLAGARDFISKPFDLLEVKARIRNMLEIRLLYKKLENHNVLLERAVEARTAELRDSEARFRRLTELASDWYWEQDGAGRFTRASGPVSEMLGLGMDTQAGGEESGAGAGWDEEERSILREKIAAREPFLDFVFSRTNSDGSRQSFHVSGEPMFDRLSRFVGYRGVGVEFVAPP